MATAQVGALHAELGIDISQYQSGLARASRSLAAWEAKQKAMVRRMSAPTTAAQSGLLAAFAPGKMLGALGAGLGVREIIQYADSWTRVGNSLKVAGVPADRMQATLDELFRIAQKSSVGIESVAQLYSRLSQSAAELGANQQQLFQFTQGVGDALKVAGTDAASASGALLQLSQALGSSTVRAEEFNSINEGARPILQAVADGNTKAAGSISRLRAMVIKGELTSRDFFESFLKGSGKLAAQAASANDTVSTSFTKLRNSLIRTFGEMDRGLGVTANLTALMSKLADAIDKIPGLAGTGEMAAMNQQFKDDLAAGMSRQQAWERLLEAASKGDVTRRLGTDLDDLNQKAAGLRQELAAVMADPQLKATPWAQVLKDQLSEIEGQIARVGQGLRDALGAVGGAAVGAGAAGGSGNLAPPIAKPGTSKRDPVADTIADLRFEQEQLGRTSLAQAIHNRLREAGISLATKQGQTIADLVTQIERERTAQDQKKTWADTVQFAQFQIDSIEAELKLRGKSTAEIEKARFATDMLQQAQSAGIPITADLRAQVEKLAGVYGKLAGKAEEADEAQRRLDDLRDVGKDAFRSIAEAMRDGELNGKRFLSILDDIAKKLWDLAMDDILNVLLGKQGSSGGGLLGSLFSGLFSGGSIGGGAAGAAGGGVGSAAGAAGGAAFHGGGIVSRGARVTHAVPAAAARSAPRFHAGLGPKELLAVLEEGETVLTKNMTSNAGRMLSGAALESRGGDVSIVNNVDARGAGPGTAEQLKQVLEQNNKQIIKALPAAIRDMKIRRKLH